MDNCNDIEDIRDRFNAKARIKEILERLYWQGRRNADIPIDSISVQPELDQIIAFTREPQTCPECDGGNWMVAAKELGAKEE